MKKQPVVYSDLLCTVCEQQLTIPRKVGRQHKPGHVKHMYCPGCKTKSPFEEKVETDHNIIFWTAWHNQTKTQ